jgi:hypothetical protein
MRLPRRFARLGLVFGVLCMSISTEEQSIGTECCHSSISTEEQSIGGARRHHAKFGMCASLLETSIGVCMPNLA